LKKPNFFGSRTSFEAAAEHDGFLLEGEFGRFTLHGRFGGQRCRLANHSSDGDYEYDDGTVTLRITRGKVQGLAEDSPRPANPHRVDLGRYHALVALLTGITSGSRIHQVNARLIAGSQS
jgi:hypothetical protein